MKALPYVNHSVCQVSTQRSPVALYCDLLKALCNLAKDLTPFFLIVTACTRFKMILWKKIKIVQFVEFQRKNGKKSLQFGKNDDAEISKALHKIKFGNSTKYHYWLYMQGQTWLF